MVPAKKPSTMTKSLLQTSKIVPQSDSVALARDSAHHANCTTFTRFLDLNREFMLVPSVFQIPSLAKRLHYKTPDNGRWVYGAVTIG